MTEVYQKARYFGQRRLQTVQNLDVFCSESLFLLTTLLRVLKQGIGSFINLTLTIVDLEVVTRKLLGLADLFGAQTLCVHEPAEVIMIGEYKHLMLGAF